MCAAGISELSPRISENVMEISKLQSRIDKRLMGSVLNHGVVAYL